jgi:hypothetical protein
MDILAVNYDSLATSDDGSCIYMNDCLGSIAQFALHPGTFVNEASYVILDAAGDTLAAGSGETSEYACLLDGCYTIAMFDSFGDGWDAGGYMDIYIDGAYFGTYTLASGLSAGTAYFGINVVGCAPAVPGCTDPLALNYNALATEDDGSCQYPLDCTDNLVTIQISTANWGSEIGWNLVDAAGSVVASGSGYSSWGWYTQYACLVDGCYELQLTDSWGDGWNGAYYMISSTNAYYEGSLYYGATAADMIGINTMCGNIPGCMDVAALNYSPQATYDDGSCLYNPGINPGLTNGLDMDFSIYPNPTKNQFNLDYDASIFRINKIQIITTLGEIIFETKTISNTITFGGIQSGMYFVKIISDKLEIIKKLIVE